ncbi:het domain protein [Stagonosporopsis vannaccii]|nr:het domain protein [Stagonosporopsis vannaccii]
MDPRIYTPLSTDSETLDIRLLRLHPSSNQDAQIQCSLFTYTLLDLGDRPHLYEALSYVWGDPRDFEEITISGFEIRVTKNLHAALRRLRDHYFERILWVDAVCIDQGNKDEVARQILSMTKIYGQASRVLVWLGEATDDSSVAMEQILSGSSEHLIAVNRLLKRPWFRRIWVLQEVAAARHIRILCGEKELDGYAFYNGLHELSRHTGVQHPSVYLLRHATFRSSPSSVRNESHLASVVRYSLLELLDLYHEYGATKRHDKIYALLGMSTDVMEVGLTPDYSCPWEELLRHVLQYLLSKSIHINTWHSRAVVTIRGQCYIIGSLTHVNPDLSSDGRSETAVLQARDGTTTAWTLWPSAKRSRVGDLLCFFKNARRASILRPYSEYFHIISINVSANAPFPPEDMNQAYDVTSLWNWEAPNGEPADLVEEQTTLKVLNLMITDELQKKCARIISIATILCNLRQYSETLERLRVMTGHEDLLLRLEDSQVEQLMRIQIICYVRLDQRHNVKDLLLRRQSNGHVQKSPFWAVIDMLDVPTDEPMILTTIEKLVAHLELRQYELTEEKLVEIATDPFHEATSYLLQEKHALFRFPETALFAVLVGTYNKTQLCTRLQQLLIQKHGSKEPDLERILELTAGLTSGAGAIVRYLCAPRIRINSILSMMSRLRDNETDQVLLGLLSQAMKNGLKVTETTRKAASGCAKQALKNLVDLIGDPQTQLTEDMLAFAARYGQVLLMRKLLQQSHQDFQITGTILEAAALNRESGGEIIIFLVDRGRVEPSFAESYLKRFNLN